MAKLSTSTSRYWKEAPVSKIFQVGLQVSSRWMARAVAELAKNLRWGKRFRLSMPPLWSPCSWVTKTASIRLDRLPRGRDQSDESRRAEKPASTRIRQPSVTMRALFPELPLPRMQNRIAMSLYPKLGPPASAMVFTAPMDPADGSV